MRRLPRLDVQRLLLLVFLGGVFAMSARIRPIDPDLWWHLANGRYIIGHGIPAADVYSFTAVGHVWVVHEWLADILMYLAYRASGLTGIMVLGCLLLVVALFLVFRLLRRGGLGSTSAVVLALVLGLASSSSWGPRPQLLNFAFAAGLCLVLLRYRAAPGRWLYWLVPAFVLWANLHSGYVFGAGLLGLFTIGEWAQSRTSPPARGLAPADLWRAAQVTVFAAAAGFLTPGTFRTVLFPFGTLGSSTIQGNIVEWSSPDFRTVFGGMLLLVICLVTAGLALDLLGERGTPGRRGALAALAAVIPGGALVLAQPDFHQPGWRLGLLVTVVAILVARLRRKAAHLPWTEVLWGLATIVLALTSLRHIPLFAAAGAPLAAGCAARLLAAAGARPRRVAEPSRAAARANLVLLLAALAVFALFAGPSLSAASLDRDLQREEPVAATRYLLRARPPRELFNFYDYGGYLVWMAQPAYPVFIDGRVEVYGDAVFGDYLDISRGAPDWEAGLDRYHVRTVLMPSAGSGKLFGRLLARHGWKLEYADSVAYVMTRP